MRHSGKDCAPLLGPRFLVHAHAGKFRATQWPEYNLSQPQLVGAALRQNHLDEMRGTSPLDRLHGPPPSPPAMPPCVASGGRDIGLLISILFSAPPEEWHITMRNLQRLRPRFSSLAIDVWRRPSNMSALDARRETYRLNGKVLALFDRVAFYDVRPRVGAGGGVFDRHVMPCVSWEMHWRSVFAHQDGFSTQGCTWSRSALPLLLAGIDADTPAPHGVENSLDDIARILSESNVARASARAANAREREAVSACARDGQVPIYPFHDVRPTPGSRTGVEDPHIRVGRDCVGHTNNFSSTPQWPMERVHPVFITANDQGHQRYSASCRWDMNVKDMLPPADRGPCETRRWPRRDGLPRHSSEGFLARGPYCPSSVFYIFHRDDLPMVLQSHAHWRAIYEVTRAKLDERTRGPPERRGRPEDWRESYKDRWEFTTCALLAPNEAALFLRYPDPARPSQQPLPWSPNVTRINEIGIQPRARGPTRNVHVILPRPKDKARAVAT
jgi:hypothetical protein